MSKFKVTKDVEISSKMSLVDLNGSKSNFETKFTIKPHATDKYNYLVSVLSQDELDRGDYNFEQCEEDGTYSRKITRQDKEHQNYYIALKKHPTDKTDKTIKCNIDMELQELPTLEIDRIPMQSLGKEEEAEPQRLLPLRRQEAEKEVVMLAVKEDFSIRYIYFIVAIVCFIIIYSVLN